jgi:uncharacterized protein YjcR
MEERAMQTNPSRREQRLSEFYVRDMPLSQLAIRAGCSWHVVKRWVEEHEGVDR